MPKIKHTPGPWSAEMDVVGSPCVVTHRDDDRAEDWIPGRSGAYIAMGIGDHTEQRTRGNEWANAVLIAAAPDMLADLVEAAATLRQYETLHRAKGTEESTTKAEVNAALASRFEATISKATQPLNPA